MPSVNFNKIQKLVLDALEDGEEYTIASLTQKINDSGIKIHRNSVEKALALIRDSQSAKIVHFEYDNLNFRLQKFWMEKEDTKET